MTEADFGGYFLPLQREVLPVVSCNSRGSATSSSTSLVHLRCSGRTEWGVPPLTEEGTRPRRSGNPKVLYGRMYVSVYEWRLVLTWGLKRVAPETDLLVRTRGAPVPGVCTRVVVTYRYRVWLSKCLICLLYMKGKCRLPVL